jgi:hypothetical protein
MRTLRYYFVVLSLCGLYACRISPTFENRASKICKIGPIADYDSWIKSSSADLEAIGRGTAIVGRLSASSFMFYTQEFERYPDCQIVTEKQLKEDFLSFSRNHSFPKKVCEVNLHTAENTPYDQQEAFQLLAPYGLFGFSANLKSGPQNGPPYDLEITSYDKCETLDYVVNLAFDGELTPR